MKCSTPGLSITNSQSLLKFLSIESEMPSTISSSVVPFSSCPQSFPASGSFQMSPLFASGDQSIRVSASASVLPMNIQDWSPLGWTGWISLQSKGLSRVFSNTTEYSEVKGLTNSMVCDGNKWSSYRTSHLCWTTCQVFYILFFTCRCSSSSHFTGGKPSHRPLVKFSQGYSAHRWSNQNTNLNFTVFALTH